ncbi:hypothetical protein C8Q79DRAFT_194672 [Trametes meyenii]|nr:hypothetical protein C8Q79DRAFT_194672 [Trametes meyenii]
MLPLHPPAGSYPAGTAACTPHSRIVPSQLGPKPGRVLDVAIRPAGMAQGPLVLDLHTHSFPRPRARHSFLRYSPRSSRPCRRRRQSAHTADSRANRGREAPHLPARARGGHRARLMTGARCAGRAVDHPRHETGRRGACLALFGTGAGAKTSSNRRDGELALRRGDAVPRRASSRTVLRGLVCRRQMTMRIQQRRCCLFLRFSE